MDRGAREAKVGRRCLLVHETPRTPEQRDGAGKQAGMEPGCYAREYGSIMGDGVPKSSSSTHFY